MTYDTSFMDEKNDSSTNGDTLRENLIAMLRTIYDPEIPVNIYDLGLIYNIEIASDGKVEIAMTLTAPACPVAGTFLLPMVSPRTIPLGESFRCSMQDNSKRVSCAG